MKQEFTINLNQRKYPVTIENHSFENLGETLKTLHQGKRLAVITDEKVYEMYGEELEKQLAKTEKKILVIKLPETKEPKSFSILPEIYSKLLGFHMTRSDALLSFGGGVVGDVTGFVAATYLRGIDYYQLPTTVISQVDSSIGGKVAVNLPEAHNVVGCFYQPQRVLIDPVFIQSLSDFEFTNGVAEIIKIAAVRDEDLFTELLRQCRNKEVKSIDSIIYRSGLAKKLIIEEDEKALGVRRLLNFGHTIGHAIRFLDHKKIYGHGHAVAIGMYNITKKSEEMGLTDKGTAELLKELLIGNGLPYLLPDYIKREDIIARMQEDKKRLGDVLNLALLRRIGEGYIYPVNINDLGEFL